MRVSQSYKALLARICSRAACLWFGGWLAQSAQGVPLGEGPLLEKTVRLSQADGTSPSLKACRDFFDHLEIVKEVGPLRVTNVYPILLVKR